MTRDIPAGYASDHPSLPASVERAYRAMGQIPEGFSAEDVGRAKRYRTIVVDPPWKFDQSWLTGSYLINALADGSREWAPEIKKRHYKRGAVANYKLMTLEEIAALPVGDWAGDKAHLYLWTTNSFMVEAHDIAKAWGFTVKTILTWVKPRLGMGTYYRNNTEHVIFAAKGNLKVLRHDVRTAFTAAQGRHSEKPAAFYDMVESMSPGPYLDVFARKQRFNWDTWGNECFVADGLPLPEAIT
jgi:N6-adenosine-specific RNA methylase IME4